MIELKITGDALEVKSEIEKLFNMTSNRVLEVKNTIDTKPLEKILNDEIEKCKKETDLPNPPLGGDVVTPERDGRGFKWDERIHSTGKTINRDGTWRNARGLSDETLETVELELAKEAQEAGFLRDDLIPDNINPVITETQPDVIKPISDAELTSAMIKFTQSLTQVKDAEGNAIIGKAVPLLMKKMSVNAVHEIKGDHERNAFVKLCKSVEENANDWETILGE